MQIIIAVVTLGIFAVIVLLYNSLVGRQNTVECAYASVDAMLKRRTDLIPQVVQTVAAYTDHERTLMEDLTKWRSAAETLPLGSPERTATERNIGGALRELVAVAESYPLLRASENFHFLQAVLNEVEDQIAASRRFFNTAVTEYNNAVRMFPWCFVAELTSFEARKWFSIPDEERAPVSVRESFDARRR